jgi:hypothetical protein
MTSSGHVTIPEATPAEAPHRALTELSGSLETLTARAATGELQAVCLFGVDISRGSAVTAEGAYRSGALVGDGGAASCVDIRGTAIVGWLAPVAGGADRGSMRTGRRPLCGASVLRKPRSTRVTRWLAIVRLH